MDSNSLPTIIYGEDQEITESVQSYMTYKGWVYVTVLLPDGSRYKVECIDPVRLAQNMESPQDLYYTEPNFIVLHEVTAERIEATIHTLYARGYFARLVPEGTQPAPQKREGIPSLTQIARDFRVNHEWARYRVTLPDGRQYETEARTPLRLQQDIAHVQEASGQFYYAKPGMMAVREATEETVTKAITAAYQRGFFDRWIPIKP
jgi:hypothetical protein